MVRFWMDCINAYTELYTNCMFWFIFTLKLKYNCICDGGKGQQKD